MFYDFLAQRDKPGGETAVGSWNSRRCYVKQFEVLRQAEALKGEVLEIGPGEGIFARLCKKAGILYQGLERSAALQNRLKEEGFAVQLGTAPPLPFENERFDLVCAFAVLEHMPTFEQALGLLQECHRVLNRTGSLALIVPDYLRCGIGFFNWDYTHSFVTSPWRVRQILYDAGFDMVRLVHFTGSLTAPPARWPLDLLGFAVHTRIVFWLASSLGLQSWLFKFHKTFSPAFLVVSRKLTDEKATSQ